MREALIYNLTLKIDKSISDQWIAEMENKIIPECSDVEIVLSTQITRILIEDPDDDTFAIQFVFPSEEIFNKSGLDIFKKMVLMIDSNFKGKYVYFTTRMEVIHYNNFIA